MNLLILFGWSNYKTGFMVKHLLAIVCLAQAAYVSAQQLPLFSEYLHNSYLINPAFAGWEGINAVSTSYRHQWTGMTGAPRTATLGYQQYMAYNNTGIAGYLMHDQTGPTSFTGVNLVYAYHIRLAGERRREWKRNRLSIGLSLAGTMYRLRGADLRYNDADDDLIINANQSKFLPDAGIGITYYNDLYYVGISTPQIVSANLRYHDDNAISNLRRVAHIYLTAGAKIPLQHRHNNKQFIIPTFWLRYAPTSPLNITANVRYMWNQVFSTGIGASTDGSMLIDFNINATRQFRIGYAFSMGVNGLARYVGTNHELMLTYAFASTGNGWGFAEIYNGVTTIVPVF